MFRKFTTSAISFVLLFLSIFALSASVNTALSAPASALPNTAQTVSDAVSDLTPGTSDTSAASNTSDAKISTCQEETGSLGWLICPAANFFAKLTDGLYEIIENFLVVKPLTSEADNPFRQVWAIFRDLTNVVFVIFLLIVIYSQLTGLGISNYGIKRALPKIIISAILINLSYLLCAVMVDASNIIGASLRDLFSGIEANITPTGLLAEATTSGRALRYSDITGLLIGGGVVGALGISLAGGAGYTFLALIPVLLGAVLSILVAYVTLAARQALVYLLIMVSPLAFVCLLLPNTEKWYLRWKQMLTTMLVFYPLFALLFGACSLISWVIISAAETPTILILGLGVRVVPLFYSWSLLKMSGTLPGQVGQVVRSAFTPAVKLASSKVMEEAQLKRAQYLGENARYFQFSRRFAQSHHDSDTLRNADIKMYSQAATDRALASGSKYFDRYGRLNKRGRAMQRMIEQNVKSATDIQRGKDDLEAGLSSLIDPKDPAFREVLAQDLRNRDAADDYIMEMARGELIARGNAVSRHERFNAALRAHDQSAVYGRAAAQTIEDLNRYDRMLKTMHGSSVDARYTAAYAAQTRAIEDKSYISKFQTYFATLPPTQDVENAIREMTSHGESAKYIDAIIAGMGTLNMRGDTDILKRMLDEVLEKSQIRLGTHASQALANFLMFEVKDNDPFLRRFGKYINLETARVYNEGQFDKDGNDYRRKNDLLGFEEYVTGLYPDIDEKTGQAKRDKDGKIIYKPAKRSAVKLMEGTSFDNVERTAYGEMDESLKKVYGDDIEGMQNKRAELMNAILPAMISAALKYPSGSEQIVNLAQFITGRQLKGDQWVKLWEKEGSPLAGFDEEFFKNQTEIFLKAQTATQILNLRTDLFNPIVETLADTYYNSLSAEDRADPEKVPSWYLDESDPLNQPILETDSEAVKAAKKARAKETSSLRDSFAKKRFIKLMHAKGKLEAILLARRSGAGLNAKDRVRDIFNLNDENWIQAFLQKAREERKLQQQVWQETHDDSSPSDIGPTLIDEHLREYFTNEVDKIYNADPSAADFSDKILDLIETKYRLTYITKRFKEYRDNNPSASNGELLDTIKALLTNENNY